MFLKIVCLAAILPLSLAANAQGAPVGKWQLSIGGLSYHIPHDRPRNEVNYGLGVEYQWTKNTAFQAGFYENSGYSRSKYLFVQYHPFELFNVRFGATAGLVDGYPTLNDGKFAPVVVATFSKQWERMGINGIFMPPLKDKGGVLFVGFKFPFDELKMLGN